MTHREQFPVICRTQHVSKVHITWRLWIPIQMLMSNKWQVLVQLTGNRKRPGACAGPSVMSYHNRGVPRSASWCRRRPPHCGDDPTLPPKAKTQNLQSDPVRGCDFQRPQATDTHTAHSPRQHRMALIPCRCSSGWSGHSAIDGTALNDLRSHRRRSRRTACVPYRHVTWRAASVCDTPPRGGSGSPEFLFSRIRIVPYRRMPVSRVTSDIRLKCMRQTADFCTSTGARLLYHTQIKILTIHYPHIKI